MLISKIFIVSLVRTNLCQIISFADASNAEPRRTRGGRTQRLEAKND